MTRFQKRIEFAEKYGVNHKHCWASYRGASDNARGWSRMGYLVFCARCQLESVKATKRRMERTDDPVLPSKLRQQYRSLRNVIRAMQSLERGEPAALQGLRAQINVSRSLEAA